MGNRDVFDRDASIFVEVPKMVPSECSSEVGDNAVRETKSMDDIFEELNYCLHQDLVILLPMESTEGSRQFN